MSEKALKETLQRYLACPDKQERRKLWAEFVKAHQSRPAETVKRMERERGLT